MRADVGIGPYEAVCNKALNYNLKPAPAKNAALTGGIFMIRYALRIC